MPVVHLVNATRLAYMAIVNLDEQLSAGSSDYVAASGESPNLMAPLRTVMADMDWENQRPKHQWWRTLRPVFDQLSRRPGQE